MKPLNKIAYAVALATVSSGSWADNTQPDAGAAPDWQQTQLAANHTQAKGASRVETLLVTGTRGSVERTVESSPAPVDVLTEDIVRKANQANLLSALNTALPSFNVPGLPGYGVNSTVKAGQLRGLNSSHVLVLVNGKRRHASSRLGAGGFAASAPVDLGLIPTGSIERIEVLRDGASAIYGSDAIAGVINIITKKDASGGSVSGRFGQHYEGDGEVQQYIARSGFELGEGGHVYVSAQLDDQQPAFRDSPVPDDVLFYFPLDANGNAVLPIGNRSTGPKLPAGATPDPREASVDRDNIVFGASGGVPEARLASFTADAALPLGAASELYGFASYAERDARSPQHFRFPSRDQVVRALWPDGFTPYSGIKETDYSLQLGAKGSDWLGWGWDISSVYGNNDIDHYQYDSNSPSYGLESKTDFYIGNYQYGAWTNNIDLRRSLESGLFGLLTDVSLGAEYRRETYKRGAGEEQSWNHGGQPILDGPNAGNPISISDAGSQADIGVRPEDVADDSRNSYAAYGGISLYPRSNWVVDLAARYEDYSDFGDITTGRLSSRYDINDNLALRGTVSSGFQAPALAAQTFRNTSPTVEYTTHTLSVDSPEAQALGAKLLQPEESLSYTLGIVASLTPNTKLAIDAYQIYVDNRISQLSTFREATHPGSGALVQAASPRFGADDAISYLINAGDTKTEGVDITLEGVFESDNYGVFRWTLAANYNETSLERVAPTPEVLSQFNIPLYSAASQVNLLYLAPRFKGIIGLEWALQDWSVGVNATRYGEIRRSTNVNQNGVTTPAIFSVGDLWLVDLEVGYQITDQLKLNVNANNLLDEEPPLLPEGSTALWPFQTYSYVNNGPVNAAGGFYSATLTYSW